MFCSKCGKEIADEALICPMCGCATANYQPTTTNNHTHSKDYIALKEFEEKVNSIFTLSIIAFVLFLGIGLIFSIVVWLNAKNLYIPSITSESPSEIAMFESLKRKLKRALNFANIPLYVLLGLVAISMFSGLVGTAILLFVVYIAILFLISMPCTKRLNQELYGIN